jgi:hypothetical protein
MLKVCLVVSVFILGLCSFQTANTFEYLAQIVNEVDNSVRAGVWTFFGWQLIILSFALALGFIIHSRKK